ncbi:hypothetical protein MKZ38_009184 [Zalerion maritima]|uniref:Cyanovirin-N domain-containing protein n=1 Tax=Zalerion maritima TaxID=339359 RepID=A0AAD5WUU7_9PEZI|nr:hypothetical protein MKZ38_009184 [Zalerion maritima]
MNETLMLLSPVPRGTSTRDPILKLSHLIPVHQSPNPTAEMHFSTLILTAASAASAVNTSPLLAKSKRQQGPTTSIIETCGDFSYETSGSSVPFIMTASCLQPDGSYAEVTKHLDEVLGVSHGRIACQIDGGYGSICTSCSEPGDSEFITCDCPAGEEDSFSATIDIKESWSSDFTIKKRAIFGASSHAPLNRVRPCFGIMSIDALTPDYLLIIQTTRNQTMHFSTQALQQLRPHSLRSIHSFPLGYRIDLQRSPLLTYFVLFDSSAARQSHEIVKQTTGG